MAKYFVTSYTNGYGFENAKESHRHAAERWGAEYVEYNDDPRCRYIYEDKYYMLEDFKPEDQIAIVDGDILYRIDCESPFDATPIDKIGMVDDRTIMERVPYKGGIHDHWYDYSLESLVRYCQEIDARIDNVFPGNTGLIVGRVDNLKKIANSIYKHANYDHVNKSINNLMQPLAWACMAKANVEFFELEVDFNFLNWQKFLSYGVYKEGEKNRINCPYVGEAMYYKSVHPAGQKISITEAFMNRLDWKYVP